MHKILLPSSKSFSSGVPIRHLCWPALSKSYKQLQQSTVSVYLELLRYAKKWPLEEGREERSLKHPLLKRLEEDMSTIEQSTDPREIIQLGQKGQKDLEAMLALLRNKAFRMYQLEEYRVPDVVNQEKTLLSTKSVNKSWRRKWGQMDRFLSWYFSEKPAPPKPYKTDEE